MESNTSHTVSARRNSAAGVAVAKENVTRSPSLSRLASTEASLSLVRMSSDATAAFGARFRRRREGFRAAGAGVGVSVAVAGICAGAAAAFGISCAAVSGAAGIFSCTAGTASTACAGSAAGGMITGPGLVSFMVAILACSAKVSDVTGGTCGGCCGGTCSLIDLAWPAAAATSGLAGARAGQPARGFRSQLLRLLEGNVDDVVLLLAERAHVDIADQRDVDRRGVGIGALGDRGDVRRRRHLGVGEVEGEHAR